jgi:hypothetical protein
MLDVTTLPGPRASRARAAAASPHLRLAAAREERMEKVGEGIFVAEQVAHFFGRHSAVVTLSGAGRSAPTEHVSPLTRIESRRTGTAPRALRLLVHLPVRSQLVVFPALVGVADHLVGFVDFLEFRLCGLVAGIHVGVVFARKLPEGLLHLFFEAVLEMPSVA